MTLLNNETINMTPISSLGEFGLIEKLTKDIKCKNKSTIKGIGDFFGNIADKIKTVINNVRLRNLDNKLWHYKHYGTTGISSNIEDKVKNSIRKEAYKGAMAEHNPVFVHFISKQLELAYK